MQTLTLTTDDVKFSNLNMRKPAKKGDLADILPSIREQGIIQNLIVRKNCEGYDIIAGQRRFAAALVVAEETGKPVELPCALVETDDDATALELSMIENMARLNPDPVQQYMAFSKLHREGRSVEEISATFGISERGVKQRLALGNLLPAILKLYQNEDIHGGTVQQLTLADKKKQKQWLDLYTSDQWCPEGRQIKSWLFDGGSISTEMALFDLADFKGVVVTDLFDEDRFFADAALFWEHQNTAIAAMKEKYLANGWTDVEIINDHFSQYDHEKVTKKDGGRVYIEVSTSGRVKCHEGYLTCTERKRQCAPQGSETVELVTGRPELSKPAQDYVSGHRHAAVKAELVKHPGIAYRLMVAQFIGSMDSGAARIDATETRNSVNGSASAVAFDEQRHSVLDSLDAPEGVSRLLSGCEWMGFSTLEAFAKLSHMSDSEVMQVAALAAAERLSAGSQAIDILGQYLEIDMAQVWQPDDALLDIVRDKSTLSALLHSAGGKKLADANVSATGKVMRSILRDLFTGANGRKQVTGWIPKYFRFPFASHLRDAGLSELSHGKENTAYVKALKPLNDQ